MVFTKIKANIQRLIRFLTYDIWRITGAETSSLKFSFYNIIKSFMLVYRNIDGSELNTRAAALTYRTLLSIVPMLAVLFGIARGFGFQNIVESQLFSYFKGQEDLLKRSMGFIDKSLEYAQGGVFLGVGVVLLLYTVVNLLSSIESDFNTIWGIKKGRSYYRQFTDYLALVIITPIFLICNAGLSVILNSTIDIAVLGVVISPMIKIIPFVITIFLFTLIYIYIPNTKVKFSSALISGVFAGTAFQLFQMLYISGQIWISKYNAIYGSFAVLPLLLLWLQLSWFICLLGVELSFAYQNVSKFSFEHETKNISRRYKDFTILIIVSLIVKRFQKGEEPYTADDISSNFKIPTRLTSELLFFLQEIGIILETPTIKDQRVPAYIPALDINQITIGFLFDKIDLYGSEDFKIQISDQFKGEWDAILNIRKSINQQEGNILIKDL